MTISKAHWDTDGDNLRLSMPINKVDKERRIVSGFATLDNIDRQGDIVTTEASLKAFSKFRGNIREMHEPIAVGKMIGFKEEKYFDPETKKFYSGVYVSAYISKGAQGTWEKVLDGTLSGFSIGGRMNKYDDAYDANMDKTVRIIKEYDLHELSLVDSPANQFANVMSIEKVDGVDVLKGDVIGVEIENVFYDDQNNIVMLSEEESMTSPLSEVQMKNIGFVEKNDSEKSDMIKFLVDSAKGINTSKITKEVSPMTDNTNAEVVEETTVADAAEVAPEADTELELQPYGEVLKAEDTDAEVELGAVPMEESEDEEETEMEDSEDKGYMTEKSEGTDAAVEAAEEVSKSDDVTAMVSELKDGIASAFSDLASTIKSLQTQVDELTKSIDSVKTEVKESKTVVNEFGKRVDAVEKDTAFRKSGDLGEIVQEKQPEKVEKSLWGGRFLKTADLFR